MATRVASSERAQPHAPTRRVLLLIVHLRLPPPHSPRPGLGRFGVHRRDRWTLNENIKKTRINSIDDINKFEVNSIEILYSLPIDSFTLIADDKENIFVAKILSYEEQIISSNSKKFKAISNEASAENRNTVLKSYDYILSDKYKVIINEKTLERVKNYFR